MQLLNAQIMQLKLCKTFCCLTAARAGHAGSGLSHIVADQMYRQFPIYYHIP